MGEHGCDGEGEEEAAGRGGEGEVRIALAGKVSGWTLTFSVITFLLFAGDSPSFYFAQDGQSVEVEKHPTG